MHEYIAYGLAIHSEIPLPELTAQPSEVPDVRIRLGGVPPTLDAPLVRRVSWKARPGEWLFELAGVGRYYVRDGCDVRIEPDPKSTGADLRAFLFSSTWGALLHQRGALVLHASAVHMPSGAVAVSGKSGVGKSTLTATLLGRGYPLLADDKVAVIQNGDRPTVIPGYPTIRLWSDALDRMDEPTDALPRLRDDLEKYLYRAGDLHAEPSPLRAVFSLLTVNEPGFSVERIEGFDAFQAVHKGTYRSKLVRGFAMQQQHLERITALVSRVPVFRIARSKAEDTVEALADAVEAAVAGLDEA